MNVFQLVFWFMRGWFRDRGELTIENLAYRQQLAAYKHQTRRPRIRQLDRVFGYACPDSGPTGAAPW